ncbi:MAG TPA: SMC-Scp complex subunit ScpB [Pirellulales bacterium]|nr:SMC-Scp complex subunit ScpB [Pirellulales bacterium]
MQRSFNVGRGLWPVQRGGVRSPWANASATRDWNAIRSAQASQRPLSTGSPGSVAPQRRAFNEQPGRDPRLSRVEAVLFLAAEPLSARKIGQFASLADATEARTLIRQLNEHYDRTGSAFRADEIAGGYQLLSRRKFGGWLRRLHQTVREARLSSPALEVLAVVAYRQPVARGEIEALRGVQCGEILRQLMERDLVRTVGRSTEIGRAFLYGTTKRFLQVFGLRDLDELPRAAELRSTASEHNQAPNTSPRGATP